MACIPCVKFVSVSAIANATPRGRLCIGPLMPSQAAHHPPCCMCASATASIGLLLLRHWSAGWQERERPLLLWPGMRRFLLHLLTQAAAHHHKVRDLQETLQQSCHIDLHRWKPYRCLALQLQVCRGCIRCMTGQVCHICPVSLCANDSTGLDMHLIVCRCNSRGPLVQMACGSCAAAALHTNAASPLQALSVTFRTVQPSWLGPSPLRQP